jgi:hypothetical protein
VIPVTGFQGLKRNARSGGEPIVNDSRNDKDEKARRMLYERAEDKWRLPRLEEFEIEVRRETAGRRPPGKPKKPARKPPPDKPDEPPKKPPKVPPEPEREPPGKRPDPTREPPGKPPKPPWKKPWKNDPDTE